MCLLWFLWALHIIEADLHSINRYYCFVRDIDVGKRENGNEGKKKVATGKYIIYM